MRFVGSVGILLLGCALACAQPVQTVRIRVYDYTAIEPQTFDVAKAEAGKRLGEAAIAVQWLRDAGRGQLRFSSEVVAGMRDGLARRWLRSGNPASVDQQLGGK